MHLKYFIFLVLATLIGSILYGITLIGGIIGTGLLAFIFVVAVALTIRLRVWKSDEA